MKNNDILLNQNELKEKTGYRMKAFGELEYYIKSFHDDEFLPASCWESADCLLDRRAVFEKDGVFPAGVINNVAARLKAFEDRGLSEKLYNKHDKISKLVSKYLHCS